MNLLWTSHELPMNFLQTSYKLPTNFLQTSYKLPTNFLQTSYKLHMNFLRTSYDHFVCITYTQNKYPPVTLSSPQTTAYHFHPTLIFSYKARACSSWAPYGTTYTKGRLIALPQNIRLGTQLQLHPNVRLGWKWLIVAISLVILFVGLKVL